MLLATRLPERVPMENFANSTTVNKTEDDEDKQSSNYSDTCTAPSSQSAEPDLPLKRGTSAGERATQPGAEPSSCGPTPWQSPSGGAPHAARTQAVAATDLVSRASQFLVFREEWSGSRSHEPDRLNKGKVPVAALANYPGEPDAGRLNGGVSQGYPGTASNVYDNVTADDSMVERDRFDSGTCYASDESLDGPGAETEARETEPAADGASVCGAPTATTPESLEYDESIQRQLLKRQDPSELAVGSKASDLEESSDSALDQTTVNSSSSESTSRPVDPGLAHDGLTLGAPTSTSSEQNCVMPSLAEWQNTAAPAAVAVALSAPGVLPGDSSHQLRAIALAESRSRSAPSESSSACDLGSSAGSSSGAAADLDQTSSNSYSTISSSAAEEYASSAEEAEPHCTLDGLETSGDLHQGLETEQETEMRAETGNYAETRAESSRQRYDKLIRYFKTLDSAGASLGEAEDIHNQAASARSPTQDLKQRHEAVVKETPEITVDNSSQCGDEVVSDRDESSSPSEPSDTVFQPSREWRGPVILSRCSSDLSSWTSSCCNSLSSSTSSRNRTSGPSEVSHISTHPCQTSQPRRNSQTSLHSSDSFHQPLRAHRVDTSTGESYHSVGRSQVSSKTSFVSARSSSRASSARGYTDIITGYSELPAKPLAQSCVPLAAGSYQERRSGDKYKTATDAAPPTSYDVPPYTWPVREAPVEICSLSAEETAGPTPTPASAWHQDFDEVMRVCRGDSPVAGVCQKTREHRCGSVPPSREQLRRLREQICLGCSRAFPESNYFDIYYHVNMVFKWFNWKWEQ